MRPKDQGTRFESWLVNTMRDAGITAERLAEGGVHDRGDLMATGRHTFIIEAKARAAGQPHAWLQKAREKADGYPTAVIWKRLTRKTGNQRRTPTGEPIIVIMTLNDFMEML